MPFLLTLAAKMAITASFVLAAAFVAQRAGPLVGAMVATLPISAGPVYVFLALDHDARFIADAALAGMVTNTVTGLYALTYAALAQRRGLAVSLGAALAVWFAAGAFTRQVEWTLPLAVVFAAAIYVPCLYFARPYRHVPMPRTERRWYDLPLRAGMVSLLVATVVLASPYLGPFGSGMLAVFPIVLTSIILILQPRAGSRPTAAVIANTVSGLVGFAIGLGMLHLTAVPLGVWPAFSLTLSICIGWNLMVWALRQRGIPL